MNKNIIKKLFLITGIIISLFSIFLDYLYKNNFYFGASQLILLLFGISLVMGYWSKKILIWMIGLIIGINIVIFNKEYFSLIDKSPVIKENIEKIDKEVVELIVDKRFNELEKFFILSQSYIDQNQFQKYFAYKNINNSTSNKNINKEFFKKNIDLIKSEIERNYFLKYEDLILQDLNFKLLKEVKYKKYKVLVFEWNAFDGNKAIGNIYIPIGTKREYPLVFSVPGCGENLWTDYPNQTNPQHRLGLLATNKIVSATTIATCSNSEYTTNARYEILSDISQGKLNDGDIAIIIWLRFFRIFKELDLIKIDKEKIGITGYSNGASIIKKLLTIDKDIKYVSLVGTVINSSQKTEKKIYSFPAERIVDSENENFYYGSGSKELNKIINKTYKKYNVTNANLITNLITFYHKRKFQLILGRKDTAIPMSQRAFLNDEITKLNKYNKTFSDIENINLKENEMDHNFSNENNIEVAKFFTKNFENDYELDINFNYRKNDKENLNPKKYFLDLKKLYLEEFEKNINKNKELNLNNIKQIFKIDDLRYNKPILLLRKTISIGDNNVIAKLYAQKIKKEIHGYFYEFENSETNKKNENSIFIYSEKNFDLELLLKSINENNFTYLTILPSYGMLNAKFNTTGNVAKQLMYDKDSPTLAGLAFQNIENIKTFLERKNGNKNFKYYASGTESNFIILVYNSVYNDLSKIKFFNHLEIKDFFSKDNLFSIPAIFFTQGINNFYYAIIDLYKNKKNVEIISNGDLENYRVYN